MQSILYKMGLFFSNSSVTKRLDGKCEWRTEGATAWKLQSRPDQSELTCTDCKLHSKQRYSENLLLSKCCSSSFWMLHIPKALLDLGIWPASKDLFQICIIWTCPVTLQSPLPSVCVCFSETVCVYVLFNSFKYFIGIFVHDWNFKMLATLGALTEAER